VFNLPEIISCANLPGFMIPIEDGVNALTWEKEEKFTVKKIDVWSLE
jgi:hypothetical protein